MDFEQLWQIHERKVALKMKKRKVMHKTLVATLAAALILSAGAFATNIFFQEDYIDYAFELDQNLVGTWEAVDFVTKPEDFQLGKQYWNNGEPTQFYLERIAFTSIGSTLVGGKDTPLAPGGLTHTKDHIVHPSDKTDSTYTIERFGEDDYLFMQWKSGDYINRFEAPNYYVFKRIDAVDHKDTVAVSLHSDITNLPFEEDPALVGDWTSVAFVESVEAFDPHTQVPATRLYLRSATFKETGRFGIRINMDQDLAYPENITWTKGSILDHENHVVRTYEIKEIEGKTYLFFPWINGDVTYRDMPVHYYVLEKTNQ